MQGKSFANYTIATLLAFTCISDLFTPKTLAQEIPKAQCLSDYGIIKCGYNCISDYGVVNCADWPGGACQADYGKVVCGPPAPPNWLDFYTNRGGSNNSKTGVYGAWAVRSESGKWKGILRMRGSVGTLIYVSNLAESVEMQMTLKRSSNRGYILEGQYITWHNLKQKYSLDNFYFQKFERNFSANACNGNQNCRRTTLTYIGN